MRMKLLGHFIVILSLLSNVAFAENNIIYVSQDRPRFTIWLDANPTTGYTWSLKSYDKKLLTPVTHAYISSNSKLVGESGHEIWILKASPGFLKSPKSTMVSLEYARPWEQGKNVKTAVYKIVSK